MNLRVLVVESDPEELLFLRDVFVDLDGSGEWSQWTHIEATFASSWKEAAALLSAGRIDVILLDLELADSRGKETFLRYQDLASQIPVVLLVQATNLNLAELLLREGAQDILIRSEVDTAPLARAIRKSIDRHRLLAATRAASMVDSLTGLLTRDAFLLLAERDRNLATSLHRRQLLILAEPKDHHQPCLTEDPQRRDMEMIEAAERLRTLAGATDLVARVGLMHLALSVLDSDQESAEEIWARLHQGAMNADISLGVAVFDPHRPLALDELLERAANDLKPSSVTSS